MCSESPMENMKESVLLGGHIRWKGVKHFFLTHSTKKRSENFIYYDFSCKNVSPYYAWIINVGQSFPSLSFTAVFRSLYTRHGMKQNLLWPYMIQKVFFFEGRIFLMQFDDNFFDPEKIFEK